MTTNSMDQFFLLQNKEYVGRVFRNFADKDMEKIRIENFSAAIDELKLILETEGRELLFNEADLDEDGGLDLKEFTRVVNEPSNLEQWTKTLPLAKLLAYCLPFEIRAVNSAADSLRVVSRLRKVDINKAAQLFGEGVARILEDRVKQLKACYDEMDRKAVEESNETNKKFQTFAMSAGKVEDFHKGLTERVGKWPAPSLLLFLIHKITQELPDFIFAIFVWLQGIHTRILRRP